MATARELFNFLDQTVLTPAMNNPRVKGRLRSNTAFTRMALNRIANRSNPTSVVRYVLNALVSRGGINTYNQARALNLMTFEDVVSILMLMYRQ